MGPGAGGGAEGACLGLEGEAKASRGPKEEARVLKAQLRRQGALFLDSQALT